MAKEIDKIIKHWRKNGAKHIEREKDFRELLSTLFPDKKIKPPKYTRTFLKQLRTAMADYMLSHGCSCCENREKKQDAEKRLAKLLNINKYPDGSGFNFYKYKTPK